MKKTQQKNVKRTRIKPPSTAKTGSKHAGDNPAESFIRETRECLFPDTGIDFIKNLLQRIQKFTKADRVYIGKIEKSHPEKIFTYSILPDGKFNRNYIFDLKGSPCEQIVKNKKPGFFDKAAIRFPDDKVLRKSGIHFYSGIPLYDKRSKTVGILAVLFKNPVNNPAGIQKILTAFSERTGKELERITIPPGNAGSGKDIAGERRHRLQLKKLEQEYLNLYESMNDILIIHDRSGNILYANPQACKKLKYSLEDIKDRKIYEIYPERKIIEIKNHIASFVRGETNVSTIPMVNHLGHMIFNENTLAWVTWKGRKSILSVSKDISRAQFSEKKFSQIFRHNSTLMALVNLGNNTVEDINEIMLKTLGFSDREDVIGKSADLLGLKGEAGDLRKLKVNIKKGIGGQGEEVTLYDRKGIKHEALRSANLLESETTRYMVLSFTDLSEKKRIENRLEKSEELINNIQQGIGSQTGEEFFSYISRQINHTLKADCTIIGKIEDPDKSFIQTIVFNVKGKSKKNIRYPLTNSPSGILAGGQALYAEKGISAAYPEDIYLKEVKYEGYAGYPIQNNNGEIIGVVITLFEKSVQDMDTVKKVINIFSGRISAEMERFTAYSALKESEERFRMYIESSPIGIAISNRFARIEYANPAMCRMTEYENGELEGMPIAGITEIKDGKSTSNFIPRLMAEGKVLNEENTIITRTGKRIFTSFDAAALPGQKFLTFQRDITTDKKNVDELIKLRSAFEQSSGSILITDTKGRIEYVNRGFEKISGYTFEDVKGKRPNILKSGFHKSGYYKNLWDTIKTGNSWRGEFLNRKKNNEYYWERAKIAPVKNTNGEIINYIAVKDDITVEKRSREELEVIVENIPLNICLIDRNYIVKKMNNFRPGNDRLSIMELMGIRQGEMIGCVRENAENSTCCLGNTDHGMCAIRSLITDAVEHANYSKDIEVKVYVRKGKFDQECYFQISTLDVHHHENEVMIIISDITESKKATLELKTSEERYKNLSEAAFEGIGLMKDGKIIDINQQLCDMYGYSREEFMAVGFENLIHPDDLAMVLEHQNRNSTDTYEHRGIRKDGSVIYLEVRSANVKRGGILYRQTVIRDVSEAKMFVRALVESEEKFRRAFKTSPDAIVIHDLEEMKYLEVNEGFLNISGFKEEEILGKTPFDSGVLSDPEQAAALIGQLKTTGELKNLEINFVKKNGEPVYTIFSANVFTLHGKKYVLSITRDITEIKKATIALQESEERNRILLNAIPDSIIVQNLKGEVLYTNPALELWDDIQPEEIGISLIHPDDRHLVRKAIKDLLESDQKASGIIENRMIHKGKLRWRSGIICKIQYQGVPALLTISRDVTLEKQAAQTIVESEKKYHRLVDTIQEGLIQIDLSGTIQFVNPSMALMTGYTPEEAIGLSVFNFTDNASAELIKEKINKRKLGNKDMTEPYDVELIRKDGARIYVRITASGMFDSTGKMVGSIATMTDITDRKKAEIALKVSEEKFRLAFKTSPDAIIILKMPDLRIVEVNEGISKITGYTEEELIGKNLVESGLSINQDYVNEMLFSLEKDGEFLNRERKNRKKDGSLIDTLISARTFNIGNEKYLMAIARDITQMKAAEVALRDSEEKYRTLSNLTIEGVLMHKGGQSIDMNKAFGDMFGYSLEDMKSSNLPDLIISENDREFAKSKYWDGDMRSYQVRGMRKDGSTFPLEVRGRFFEYKGEKLRVIVTRDLTEQKKAEKAFRESELRYKMLFNAANDAIFIMKDSEFIECNDKTTQMFGCTREQILNSHPYDFSPEKQEDGQDSREAALNHIHAALKGELLVFEWIHKKYNGKLFNAEVSLNKIELGKDTYIQAIVRDITDRKKAEIQLRENQLFIQRITEQSPDIIYIYDVHTDRNIYINKNLGEILGYDVNEVPEDSLALIDQLIHPDDRQQFYDNNERLKSWDSQYIEEYEFRLKHKTGQWRWFAGREKEFMREQNEIVSVMGVITDITLQKNAESALKFSEEKFRLAFKTSPDAIGIVRLPDFEFVEVNDGMVHMVGYTEDELIGKNPLILDIALHQYGVQNLTEKLGETGQLNNIEQKIRRKDGKILDTLLSAKYLSLNDEPFVLIITRDITEIKAANTALQASEEKFSKAFGLSPDLICLIDEKTLTISDINNSITDLFGYQKEEVIGLKFADLGEVTDRQKLFHFLTHYRKNNGKLWEEVSLKSNNGNVRICEMSATRLLVNNKYFIMAILRDVTDRKEAEMKLEKNRTEMMDLNKKIAEYKVMALRSAMNPHFIFNSLNSIQYYIGVNEKKLAITYLSLFSKLIRNILNSSVNVRNTLEKELETLTYYMQMERMRFEDKFTFEIIVNETIEQEYIQVPSLIFQPFVENAILHGLMHKDATGRIEVRISEKEDGILCEITDDGIGREAARKITENQNKSHTSFGVSLTKARLDVINKTENVSVNYIDLKDSNGNPAGTKVELFIVC